MDVSENGATPISTATHIPSKSSAFAAWLWVVIIIALLLVLLVVMIAAWQIADLRSDLARASNTLQLVSSQQQLQWQDWNQAHPQLKNQLLQLNNEQTEQLQQLSQLQQQFDTWRSRWEQELAKDPLKRQINELQDLLDHAHRHLLLTASAPQTQALLEQAHALCTRFQSNLLQPVCLLIAQDKQALAQYAAPDTHKILEQLSQLENALSLPLQQAQRLQFTPSTSSPLPETTTDNWRQYLLRKLVYFGHELGTFVRDHLVKVHHLHESGNDRYRLHLPEFDQLATRLSLLFQQARIALLIQNQPIFQSTLSEIQRIATANASLLPNEVAWQAEIEQLKNQSILQTPPLTLKANEMLNRLLKGFGGGIGGASNVMSSRIIKDNDDSRGAKPTAAASMPSPPSPSPPPVAR